MIFAVTLINPYILCIHRVTEPNSGRGIEIYTTQPGVQLYTANGLDGGLKGKGGIAYQKYGAFCLETQNWPDAINHVSTKYFSISFLNHRSSLSQFFRSNTQILTIYIFGL